MVNDERTAEFHIDGKHYVFTGDAVDEVMRRARAAPTQNLAWVETAAFGEQIGARVDDDA